MLDDLSPLRQLDAKTAAEDVVLFAPREAVRLHPAGFQGTPEPKDEPMGENPPRGAAIDYVAGRATGPVAIEILDAQGRRRPPLLERRTRGAGPTSRGS